MKRHLAENYEKKARRVAYGSVLLRRLNVNFV